MNGGFMNGRVHSVAVLDLWLPCARHRVLPPPPLPESPLHATCGEKLARMVKISFLHPFFCCLQLVRSVRVMWYYWYLQPSIYVALKGLVKWQFLQHFFFFFVKMPPLQSAALCDAPVRTCPEPLLPVMYSACAMSTWELSALNPFC